MKTPKRETRLNRTDRNKKTKKKTKIGREAIAARLTRVPRRGPGVSFLFRLNLVLFFTNSPRERESRFQTHLASRANLQFFVARGTTTTTTQDTRARAHLSSLESRRRGEVREEQRERARTFRVFERRKRRFKRRRCTHTHWKRRGINEKSKSTRERLGRRQRTRRTVAETHIEQHTHTHTHTERERERERGTDNAQREIE